MVFLVFSFADYLFNQFLSTFIYLYFLAFCLQQTLNSERRIKTDKKEVRATNHEVGACQGHNQVVGFAPQTAPSLHSQNGDDIAPQSDDADGH